MTITRTNIMEAFVSSPIKFCTVRQKRLTKRKVDKSCIDDLNVDEMVILMIQLASFWALILL